MSGTEEYVVYNPAIGKIGIMRPDGDRFHPEFTDEGLLEYLAKRREEQRQAMLKNVRETFSKVDDDYLKSIGL
jgi:hypothetical protein